MDEPPADERRPVSIRDADAHDLPALRDVYRRSSLSNERDRPRLLARPGLLELPEAGVSEGRCRVAVVDGDVVGFCVTAVDGDALELEKLFVDPAAMRCGIGRALVLDAVSAARDRHLTRITVSANDHAIAFYERVGFVVTGSIDLLFGPTPRMALDARSGVAPDGQ